MTDHFTRLIASHRGAAPAVTPRLPSRFEPDTPWHGELGDLSASAQPLAGEPAPRPGAGPRPADPLPQANSPVSGSPHPADDRVRPGPAQARASREPADASLAPRARAPDPRQLRLPALDASEPAASPSPPPSVARSEPPAPRPRDASNSLPVGVEDASARTVRRPLATPAVPVTVLRPVLPPEPASPEPATPRSAAPPPVPPAPPRKERPEPASVASPPTARPRLDAAPPEAAPGPEIHVTIGRLEIRPAAPRPSAAPARGRSAPDPLEEYLRRVDRRRP